MWTVIIIIFILWLLGAFGGNVFQSFPKTGNWVHSLIVIAIILLILKDRRRIYMDSCDNRSIFGDGQEPMRIASVCIYSL